jgi:ureidoglycolate hydrolase
MRMIKAQVMTKQAYAKYGTLIERDTSGKPDVEREYLNYWGDIYDLEFDNGATTGYLEMFRQKDFVVNQLERHVTGPEIFIPVEGVSLMAFAPAGDNSDPDDNPDVDKIEIFIVDGTQGIVIERGVWHFPPLPITPVMRFMLTVPKDVGEDLDIKEFKDIQIML